MFSGKKKREKQLEAEKAAARKIMEEAGIDLGHEAAAASVKSTKGAPSSAPDFSLRPLPPEAL